MRLWLIAGAVAGAIAFVGGTYIAGHRAGTAGCELRMAEAVAAERARQDAATEAALAEAETRVEIAAGEIAVLAGQVAEYESQLAQVCLVPSDDAERLNAIR